jgi:dolichol-phosphate mannosyltransferase
MIRQVVLIPTYNEAESITDLLQELQNIDIDVIVIDDDSPDKTSQIVKNCNFSNVRVIDNGKKKGIGSAYLTGMTLAIHDGYELIATMDADGSHLVRNLQQMLEMSRSYDVVMGTRWISGGSVTNWSLHRRLLSQFGTWYASKTLALPYKDLTGGLRVYKGSVLKRLNLEWIRSNGYCFQIEMIRAVSTLDSLIAEFPIQFIEREQGRSKMSRSIVLEAFYRVSLWGLFRFVRYNADKLHYVK